MKVWKLGIEEHWMQTGDGIPPGRLPISVKSMWFWYASRAIAARRVYVLTEIAAIAVAAAIPAAAALGASAAVAAVLGAIVVLLGGLRTAFAWQESWISYTQTRYAIEREVVRWQYNSTPYNDSNDRDGFLANTVQDLAADEGKSWAQRRRATVDAIRQADEGEETGRGGEGAPQAVRR